MLNEELEMCSPNEKNKYINLKTKYITDSRCGNRPDVGGRLMLAKLGPVKL